MDPTQPPMGITPSVATSPYASLNPSSLTPQQVIAALQQSGANGLGGQNQGQQNGAGAATPAQPSNINQTYNKFGNQLGGALGGGLNTLLGNGGAQQPGGPAAMSTALMGGGSDNPFNFTTGFY